MYFIQYFHYVNLIYYFHLLQLCGAQTSRALVLTKENDEFKLTIPDSYDPDTKESKFTVPKNGKIHFFCRANVVINKQYVYLKTVKKNFGSEFSDMNICDESALPVFVKVNNPQDLKNNVWDVMNMDLYHSGYLLSTDIPVEKKKNYGDPRKPEYDGWKSSDYELLVETEVYYNKTLKQVVATEYTLLSTNLPIHEQFVSKDFIALHGRNKLFIPEIMIYADRPEYSYLKLFKNKLSENWTKILSDAENDNYLSMTLLASNLHFPIPLWERHALQTFNTIPIFLKPRKMWQKVQQFSRIVAKHFGDLKVKTGITDTMTLSGIEIEDTEGFRFPKYLWNAYEYHDRNEAYGIIVVLNYNPFEETEMKICETKNTCNDNGWIIGNDDFREGEIYCCGMTRDNIHKLKVDFMALKEKPVFNLHKWEDKMGKIKTDFVDILNQEIKKKQDSMVKGF